MKTQVNIDKETRRKIIDLRSQHKKKIREIVEIAGKSSRDVTAVLKEHEIQQAQTTKDEIELRYTKALKTVMATSFQMSKLTNCLMKEKVL